jgi:hypothetical protein
VREWTPAYALRLREREECLIMPKSIVCIVPLLAALVGCMPARDAGDNKTFRAYNKVTGEYFDVKVPNDTRWGRHGTLSSVEPSREKVERTVDDATSKAETSSSMDRYLHSLGGTGSHGSSATTPSSGPSLFDHTSARGSSYHDSSSPFSR